MTAWINSLLLELGKKLSEREKKQLKKKLTIVFLDRMAAKKLNLQWCQ